MDGSKPEVNGCVLCGSSGVIRRRRPPYELAASYGKYLGAELSATTVNKYFKRVIEERNCHRCGVRTYTPAHLGESDYYQELSAIYPWYYGGIKWDKEQTISYFLSNGVKSVIEIGCGSGQFLAQLERVGMAGCGIDINVQAVKVAKDNGLAAYLPEECPIDLKCEALCMFQTIEHILDPVGVLISHIDRYSPDLIVLSAPAFDSLLGYTTDPLVWPPHHRSAWSARGFKTLAERLGRKVTNVLYEPLTFTEFIDKQSRESGGRLTGLPKIPNNRLGNFMFKLASFASLKWAARAHTVLVFIR